MGIKRNPKVKKIAKGLWWVLKHIHLDYSIEDGKKEAKITFRKKF